MSIILRTPSGIIYELNLWDILVVWGGVHQILSVEYIFLGTIDVGLHPMNKCISVQCILLYDAGLWYDSHEYVS